MAGWVMQFDPSEFVRNPENQYVESLNESSDLVFKDYTSKVLGDIMQKRTARQKQLFPSRNTHRTSVSLDFSKMKTRNSEKKKAQLNNTSEDINRFIIKKSSLDTRTGKMMGGTKYSSTYQGYSNESSPNQEGIQKSIFGASAINFNQTSRGAFPGNLNLANR